MNVHAPTKKKVNEQNSSSKFDYDAEPEVLNDVTMHGGANEELLNHKIKISLSKKGAKSMPHDWKVIEGKDLPLCQLDRVVGVPIFSRSGSGHCGGATLQPFDRLPTTSGPMTH
jgi:hypothetical protein